ncbi:MAG: PCRF domain-containing protein, partial [Planctomycetota bacterium]
MIEQKNSLLAKLDQIEARYSEIEEQIATPEVACDSARLVALSKEQGKLKAMVTRYRQYKQAVAGIEEAEQILADSGADEDFKALATEEIKELQGKKDALLEEITNSFVMADDMDVDS